VIRTERLLLRRWRDDDRPPFAAMNQDPVVMEHFPGLTSPEVSNAFVDRIEAQFDAHGWGLWAIEVPDVAPFIGFTGLWPADFVIGEPTVEVGWRLTREHWGRGYATEAARAVLRFGFEQVGLDEIVSFTVPQNGRSRRVMERIGLIHDPSRDFEHPQVDPGRHPHLVRHVLYRLDRATWDEAAERAVDAEEDEPAADEDEAKANGRVERQLVRPREEHEPEDEQADEYEPDDSPVPSHLTALCRASGPQRPLARHGSTGIQNIGDDPIGAITDRTKPSAAATSITNPTTAPTRSIRLTCITSRPAIAAPGRQPVRDTGRDQADDQHDHPRRIQTLGDDTGAHLDIGRWYGAECSRPKVRQHIERVRQRGEGRERPGDERTDGGGRSQEAAELHPILDTGSIARMVRALKCLGDASMSLPRYSAESRDALQSPASPLAPSTVNAGSR
jgi:RimJ/RimL family protein N-acetyltransferase